MHCEWGCDWPGVCRVGRRKSFSSEDIRLWMRSAPEPHSWRSHLNLWRDCPWSWHSALATWHCPLVTVTQRVFRRPSRIREMQPVDPMYHKSLAAAPLSPNLPEMGNSTVGNRRQ
ncbi:hypothetical protein BDV37DRAFT_2575 [Aspergillus pseudonomiae]|uniref:Uncharacterized protein n=1 Tax=Aspergillus pseudonomiae TaxID=1506151 RepID=A0A5N7DVB3_9EURO|nr:uncharacterized protein BDV37DRAFT_2575 [Aspergillus pseudonomiae]KAE8409979.1 hypothetical protein BDV37DRAFT_2575 [Aspergillus pseudonomiae]